MTRDEFRSWYTDFAARFPDTGDWLSKLSAETRDLWFTDVFAHLDLSDCRAANIRLMETGELEAWKRERIPAIVSKTAGEIAWQRNQRQEQIKQRRHLRRSGTVQNLSEVGSIYSSEPYRRLRTLMTAWKRENENMELTPEVIHDLTKQVFEDELATDPHAGPRFTCPVCKDTGFVGYREDGKTYAEHCSCERGLTRKTNFKERGRTLGRRIEKHDFAEYGEAVA